MGKREVIATRGLQIGERRLQGRNTGQTKEENEMKTIYKLDGKKISKKALVEKMGAARLLFSWG